MLFLPLLTALLGCASASQQQQQQQQQQQPLGPADDAPSLTVPPTGPASPAPPPPLLGRRDRECGALDAVFRGVDTAVEGAVHAGAGGMSSLYICRRAGGRDCGLVGGFCAAAVASLFLLLTRLGGGGGFGWPSVDDVTFCASAASLGYLLYLNIWSGPASRRTAAWLSFTFFQALILLYRGFRDSPASGEQMRLLFLGWVQTAICLLTFLFSAFRMA